MQIVILVLQTIIAAENFTHHFSFGRSTARVASPFSVTALLVHKSRNVALVSKNADSARWSQNFIIPTLAGATSGFGRVQSVTSFPVVVPRGMREVMIEIHITSVGTARLTAFALVTSAPRLVTKVDSIATAAILSVHAKSREEAVEPVLF